MASYTWLYTSTRCFPTHKPYLQGVMKGKCDGWTKPDGILFYHHRKEQKSSFLLSTFTDGNGERFQKLPRPLGNVQVILICLSSAILQRRTCQVQCICVFDNTYMYTINDKPTGERCLENYTSLLLWHCEIPFYLGFLWKIPSLKLSCGYCLSS